MKWIIEGIEVCGTYYYETLYRVTLTNNLSYIYYVFGWISFIG